MSTAREVERRGSRQPDPYATANAHTEWPVDAVFAKEPDMIEYCAGLSQKIMLNEVDKTDVATIPAARD